MILTEAIKHNQEQCGIQQFANVKKLRKMSAETFAHDWNSNSLAHRTVFLVVISRERETSRPHDSHSRRERAKSFKSIEEINFDVPSSDNLKPALALLNYPEINNNLYQSEGNPVTHTIYELTTLYHTNVFTCQVELIVS